LLAGLALDEKMDDFQQFREFLNFINHDLPYSQIGLHNFSEAFRPGGKLAMGLWIEQIDPQGFGKPGPRPESLPRSPGSQQEKMIIPRIEESRNKFHNESQYGDNSA